MSTTAAEPAHLVGEVRAFVSSTFRDMHAERDHLVTVVFPELRERLERLGLEFYDVDLRWGVPEVEVDGERANSWRYCKQWIDRVEPFFVCILGQRYGWVPEPQEIEDSDDRAAFEGMSVTEMEIRHGVLTGRVRRRSYFYLRRTNVPEDAPPELYSEFVDAQEQNRLAELKTDVGRSGRPVRKYDCEWTGSGFASLDEFGRLVLEDLWSGVLRDGRYVSLDAWRQVLGREPAHDPLYADETRPIPPDVWEQLVEHAKPALRDPLDEEAAEMAGFARSRLRWFKGRRDELAELTRFVEDDLPPDASRLCVVAAAPGQGKSALLARFAAQLAASRFVVVSHFVGASERSSDVRSLIERLVGELDRTGIFGAGDEDTEGHDLESLRNRLAARLGDYDDERRIVLLVDAVNQLLAGHDLTWIPQRLGPGVRVVVSCIDDPTVEQDSPEARVLEALARRHPPPRRVALDPLGEEDVREIVKEYLEEYCKVLEQHEQDRIAEMEQARNPLYLLVMLNELRTLGGNDMQRIVRERIEELPRKRPMTVDLFDWVLERSEVFGREAMQRWCAYLFLGRVGMSSRELSDLLKHDLGEEGAAAALRIERGIRRYLQRRGAQLDFFHGQLRQAVERRYLKAEETRRAAHAAISRYFREQADPSGEKAWDGGYERGLSELPYHLAEAERLDDVYEVLTDFRFLEHKAAEVGIVDQADGTKTYTGVFQLQDDYELALAKMGGDGAATAGRRPLIVTGVDFRDGNGLVLRCPWCNTSHPFQEEWRGAEIPCPNCQGPLKVNSFVVGERSGV